MDLLDQARVGFETIDAQPANRQEALRHLGRWLTEAEFAPYQPQLEWLIRTQQWGGLLDRFYQILPFGTGGRRGAVGIGPNRMNLWTLGASVQGHCQYLKERFPGVNPIRVVLAFDVRQFEDKRKSYNPDLPNPMLHLSSRTFAQHAIGVYAANGIHASILPENSTRFWATPELSFAIRQFHAQGGLNISASHNPPDDNGGKFYDERGAQPVPPEDQIMADIVDQVRTIHFLPWKEAVHRGLVAFIDDTPHQAYIELCRKQSLIAPPRRDELRVVFTPLHGVGSMTAMEVLELQGFTILPVAEQMQPDGQFPNVTKSPNPEVPESMDRAQALAEAEDADLVLATDPDADRLGCLAPEQTPKGIRFRFLNGHTLAALLTHFKLSKLAEQGRMPRQPIVAKTLVTTELVSRIARSFQVQMVDNLLVGFKYVADMLWKLEQQGAYEEWQGTPEDFVLACEESHGLLVTPHIRDKDAGGAALLLAEMALAQKRQGRSVLAYLDVIHRQFGYFSNDICNMIMPGIEGKQNMARMLTRMRSNPPKTIGGLAVTGFDDLQDEQGWMGPFKGATDKAARNFLLFRLGDFARVALRPSGTEPKAKAYIEVSSPPCSAGTSSATWKQICADVDKKRRQLGDDVVTLAMSLTK